MSERKAFAHDASGYVLMGDAKDIAVPNSKRQSVYEWAGLNKVSLQLLGTLGGTDVWRVPDEQQRAWFNLRWS